MFTLAITLTDVLPDNPLAPTMAALWYLFVRSNSSLLGWILCSTSVAAADEPTLLFKSSLHYGGDP